MNQMAAIGGIAAAYLILSRRSSSSSSGGSIGSYKFPPPKLGQQYDRISKIAKAAESATGIKYLRDFLMAIAHNESRGNPSAYNTKSSAMKGFCRDENYNGRYKNNKWRPPTCSISARYMNRWALAGGAFGLMPYVALSTSGGDGLKNDPATVFDLPYAVAYAVDYLVDMKNKYGAYNFDMVKAGWWYPSLAGLEDGCSDWACSLEASENRRITHSHLQKSIAALSGYGVRSDLANLPVNTSSYPGFSNTLRAALIADGRG